MVGDDGRPWTPPPAGWYPFGDGATRYWDGSRWTDHVSTVQPAQSPYPLVPAPLVAPKSPGLAVIASFFVPGLGQLVNGEVGKAVVMFALWLVCLALIFVLNGFLLAPVVWVWGMVDAYSSAQRWNLQRGIIS
jgi:TM2 domain-containing membrane protein YozV